MAREHDSPAFTPVQEIMKRLTNLEREVKQLRSGTTSTLQKYLTTNDIADPIEGEQIIAGTEHTWFAGDAWRQAGRGVNWALAYKSGPSQDVALNTTAPIIFDHWNAEGPFEEDILSTGKIFPNSAGLYFLWFGCNVRKADNTAPNLDTFSIHFEALPSAEFGSGGSGASTYFDKGLGNDRRYAATGVTWISNWDESAHNIDYVRVVCHNFANPNGESAGIRINDRKFLIVQLTASANLF